MVLLVKFKRIYHSHYTVLTHHICEDPSQVARDNIYVQLVKEISPKLCLEDQTFSPPVERYEVPDAILLYIDSFLQIL